MIVFLLIAAMALSGTSVTYGATSGFETGGFNEWIKVTAPSTPFDLEGYGQQWRSNFDFSYAPYMRVYKFTVEKGEDYTLYMKMPLGEGYMNMNVTGLNPEKDTYSYMDQTIAGFIMYFQQPWAPRDSNIDVYRKNFKVASNSESRDLYVLCSFEHPNKSFEFMLKTPKDSDEDVENATDNPYVPDRNGYTWGGVLEVPVYLEASGSNETQSTTTHDHSKDHMQDAEDMAQITDFKDSSLLTLGQTYMFTSVPDMDTLRMKEAYIDDYATAYQLYEYQLQAGKEYTFDFLYK